MTTWGSARPLILAAHGSESHGGRAALARFVNAVRRSARGVDVQDAFLDVEQPSVAEVLGSFSGPRTVVPLLLHSDATSRLVAAAASDPHVSVTPMLGPDWAVAEVLVQRLIESGARTDDTIVLATAALPDRSAVDEVGRAARLLSAVWGGPVHVGALGGAGASLDTPLDTAIDIARAHGHRVVAASYVLTDGAALEAIRAAGADVATAPLLNDAGPDPRLVGLVLDRFAARGASTADV